MYKVDLHTHSTASPDGGLKLEDYQRVLQKGLLDYIAITDHNTVDFALVAQQELGEQIIIGEEITTTEGEVIGLYLTKTIPAGLSAAEAVAAIKAQKGLVYIPHPFETVRKGLSQSVLDAIAHDVDIIEIHNGRAVFQNRGQMARAWAAKYKVAGAASSDAHGKRGWGRTYSIISEAPRTATLAKLLKAATYRSGNVGVGVVYPKLNRIRRRRRAS